MVKKTELKLIGVSTANPGAPPRSLGKAGRAQWEAIQNEYAIADCGGLTLLEQVCAAIDEIAECAEIIGRDGRMVRGKFGPREHPLIKTQLSLRTFVCRTLQRLGVTVEPVQAVGRPPGKVDYAD